MRNRSRVCLWAFVAVLLVSGAMIAEATAQTFVVYAGNHSVARPFFPGTGLNTRVNVSHGQVLVITAGEQDTWSHNQNLGFANANGFPNFLVSLGDYTFPVASLVGSLDGGQTFFPVGTLMQMTVLRSGTLRLYFWDADFVNNVDNVRVDVKVYNP